MQEVMKSAITTTMTTTTTKTIHTAGISCIGIASAFEADNEKKSDSPPGTAPTVTKESFLRGVDRCVACHGGGEVLQWIEQWGEKTGRSVSPARGGSAKGWGKAHRETSFDAWLRRHRNLTRSAPPQHQHSSPPSRPLQHRSPHMDHRSPHMDHRSLSPASTSTVALSSPSPARLTRSGMTYYESPLKWGTPQQGYRLARGGNVHHPASSGTSPARVESLSPPKVVRALQLFFSGDGDLVAGAPAPPPPTPLSRTPPRRRASYSAATPESTVERCVCSRHTHSSSSPSPSLSTPSPPPRKPPARQQTRSTRQKRGGYVWVPPSVTTTGSRRTLRGTRF